MEFSPKETNITSVKFYKMTPKKIRYYAGSKNKKY